MINQMEKYFLAQLHYDVHVTRTTYTQFYFELRDLSDQVFPLKPLSEEDVSRALPRYGCVAGRAADYGHAGRCSQGRKLEAQGAHLNSHLISAKDRWQAREGVGSRSLTVKPGEKMMTKGSGKFVLS